VACACKKKKVQVELKGGMRISKATEAEALAFSAKNPGSRVIKPAA
jgi:hypothetical protein